MCDYLKIIEKFKNCKEISDLCDEIYNLRWLFQTEQSYSMQEYIENIKNKYLKEALEWNSINSQQPQSLHQAFMNAENFLYAQGVNLIIKKIENYKSFLKPEEISLIENLCSKNNS